MFLFYAQENLSQASTIVISRENSPPPTHPDLPPEEPFVLLPDTQIYTQAEKSFDNEDNSRQNDSFVCERVLSLEKNNSEDLIPLTFSTTSDLKEKLRSKNLIPDTQPLKEKPRKVHREAVIEEGEPRMKLPKLQHEEPSPKSVADEDDEIGVCNFLGMAMPSFSNKPPRIGLSKKQKYLKPLHKI